jgi:predicted HD phosphohydrolase
MTPDDTVRFTRMDQGTREEYRMLAGKFESCYRALPDNALEALKRLAGDKLGYQVDRLEHSLQTATRAFREGAEEETVVCALLHDIGDLLAPENHGELAAAVLRPYVSEANYWVVQHHPVFQGYYYYHHVGLDRDARERYRGHPHFERCAAFCERWDQLSFDPAYESMPLSAFEPMVRRLFGRKPFQYGN